MRTSSANAPSLLEGEAPSQLAPAGVTELYDAQQQHDGVARRVLPDPFRGVTLVPGDLSGSFLPTQAPRRMRVQPKNTIQATRASYV